MFSQRRLSLAPAPALVLLLVLGLVVCVSSAAGAASATESAQPPHRRRAEPADAERQKQMQQNKKNLYQPPPPLKPGETKCPFDNKNLAECVNNAMKLQQSDPATAEACFIQGLRIDPNFAITYNNYASLLGEQGRLDQAIEMLDRAVKLDPGFYQAHFNRGYQHFRQGKYKEAIKDYGKAVKISPQPDFYNSIAISAWYLNDQDMILKATEKGLALKPDDLNLLYNRANALKDLGRPAEAETLFNRALELYPDSATTWNSLGTLYHDIARYKDALAAFKKAVKLDPKLGDAWSNLGNLLSDTGKIKEAMVAAKKALAINPKDFRFLNNAGLLYRRLSKLKDAINVYEQATVLQPTNRAPWFNLGNVYKEDMQLQKAMDAYKQALNIDPEHASTMMALGSVYYDLQDNRQASHWFTKAVRSAPDDPEVRYNAGSNFKEMGDYEKAIEHFTAAIRLIRDPNQQITSGLERNRRYLLPRLELERFYTKNYICDWNNRTAEFRHIRQLIRSNDTDKDSARMIPFQAISYPLSGPELLHVARSYAAAEASNMRGYFEGEDPLPLPSKLAPGQKLRIGYVSADFNQHPVCEDMLSVYKMHDRSKFEIYAYSLFEEKSTLTNNNREERKMHHRSDAKASYNQVIRDTVDHYVELMDLSNLEAARRINKDQIHILIDLNGYTRGQRMAIFSGRPAPIQALYKGYAGTTGADFFDYVVSDPIVSPPVLQKIQFSEKVVNLPDQFFVSDFRQSFREVLRAEELRKPRASIGLPEDKFIFCDFNKLYKIEPVGFALWIDILQNVPNSVLWLLNFHAEARRNLIAHALTLGLVDAAERVLILELMPKDEHLLMKSHCDLFLDTFQYNAHGTAAEALWAGVPVLTMAGPKMTARVAASLNHAANMTETVVYTLDDYKKRAVKLARDHLERKERSLLSQLRKRLGDSRDSVALFDTAKWVRNWERALQGMWEIHAAGLQPHPLNL